MRCSVSRSCVRRLRRSLSFTMMSQNFSWSEGGRSGSASISALPRMAVSGVRSSCATSLMNSFWRRSLMARSCCCWVVVCTRRLKSLVSRSASYMRPSGSNVTGAPLRNAAVFFARSLSGSDRKCPISRLMQKMTTPMGISASRTAMEASYTSMHTTAVTTAASRLSSVAKSAKYVCSRFIA